MTLIDQEIKKRTIERYSEREKSKFKTLSKKDKE